MRREPLAHLVNCLQQCVAKQLLLEEGGADPVPRLQQGREVLEAVAERMSKCEMDDFELVSSLLRDTAVWL